MNIRTLSKEDTIHVINLSCMVLAWGVSGFYLEPSSSSRVTGAIGEVLLTPAMLLNKTLINVFHSTSTLNSIGLFISLWLSYFLVASRLSFILRIKDHGTSELRNWYFEKRGC